MAYSRRLPGPDKLRKHVEDGLTNRQIGELYGVSGESVRQQLERNGIQRPRRHPDHSKYLPWTIRADHAGNLIANRLRSYSKQQQRLPLSSSAERLLEEWKSWMDGGNRWGVPMSVCYSQDERDGFWIQPRQPGDEHYIHIPRQTATG